MPALPAGHPTSLTPRGYGIAKEGLSEAALKALRSATTVTPASPPMGQPAASFSVRLESRSKIYVPSYLGLASYGVPTSPGSLGGSVGSSSAEPMRPEAAFLGELRESQGPPVRAYLEAARDPLRRGGVINMVCAAGKTVMALFIASSLGKKTLVIVHKEFLMAQWRERIEQFLPGASVGRVQGAVFDVEGRDVVLCMLQSLALREYDMASAGFGTVIVDECHHTSAEVFSRALHSVNFDHSLGLSATIKRKDGLGHVFQWFLGPVVYKSKRAKESGVSVEAWEFLGSDPAYREECWIYGKQLNTARMISNVCGCLQRSEFVATLAMVARAAGRTTLVLSERRAHLVDIERFLCRMFEEAGEPPSVGYYVGGLKQEELKRSESCAVLLGTYAMAAEGMDIPSLNTLVMASPKTDIEQSVGRILRVKADARTVRPLVIDVVDPFSVFAAQASKRQNYYRKCGYAVTSRGYPRDPGGVLLRPPESQGAPESQAAPESPGPPESSGNLESFAFVGDI